MGSKKATRAYSSENLKFLAQTLVRITQTKREDAIYREIEHAGLEKAIKSLPKQDRENIEKFWGLTGGINHSKKLGNGKNDLAFLRQSNQAVRSLGTLFRLDYMRMFDKGVQRILESLTKKLNKNNMQITDLEAMKYLLVFLVFFQNGPKLPFEEDPLAIDSECNPESIFDEYTMLKEMEKECRDIPDGSINIKLIYDFVEMLDVKDALTIKKSLRIEVATAKIPEELRKLEIEPIYTLQQVRDFKERVFPYGPWEISNELILGNTNRIINLEEFMKDLNEIRKNWTKVEKFKSGQMVLRTPHELRTLDVYNIGGLEFTDIYEVMFLYLERNIITP